MQHSDQMQEWVDGCFNFADERGGRMMSSSASKSVRCLSSGAHAPSKAIMDAQQAQHSPTSTSASATQLASPSHPTGTETTSSIDGILQDDSMMFDLADLVPDPEGNQGGSRPLPPQSMKHRSLGSSYNPVHATMPSSNFQHPAGYPQPCGASQHGRQSKALPSGNAQQGVCPTVPSYSSMQPPTSMRMPMHNPRKSNSHLERRSSAAALPHPNGAGNVQPFPPTSSMSWTVHDGQFFAEHLREKRPRAPNEMRRAEDDEQRYRQAAREVERWRQQCQLGAMPVVDSVTPNCGMPVAGQLGGPPLAEQNLAGNASSHGMPWPAVPASPMDAITAGLTEEIRSSVVVGQFFRRLLDMLPNPIFVRTAKGEIIFTNRCGSLTLGGMSGMTPEPWQVTPQVAAQTHPSRQRQSASAKFNQQGRMSAPEGELDLPIDPVPLNAPPSVTELPPPSNNYYVLLQGAMRRAASLPSRASPHRLGPGVLPPSPLHLDLLTPPHPCIHAGRGVSNRTVLAMHRIPFWLASEDSSNTQQAVVMYVATVPGESTQMFFPAVNAGGQRGFA